MKVIRISEMKNMSVHESKQDFKTALSSYDGDKIAGMDARNVSGVLLQLKDGKNEITFTFGDGLVSMIDKGNKGHWLMGIKSDVFTNKSKLEKVVRYAMANLR